VIDGYEPVVRTGACAYRWNAFPRPGSTCWTICAARWT